MTRIHQQTTDIENAFDGKLAVVFNGVSLFLAGFLLFAALVPA
jgi:hypothetical protein